MKAPIRDEIWSMIDHLNRAAVEYVVSPTEERMSQAKAARMYTEAGLALVFDENKKLREALDKIAEFNSSDNPCGELVRIARETMMRVS